MIRKSILILIPFLLLVNGVFAIEKPQKYMPYPIIFVSGIRTTPTSPSTSWPSTEILKEFKKYYLFNPDKPNETSKYEDTGRNTIQEGEKSHLEFFFYDSKEAPVDVNANMLKNEIEKILSKEGSYYDTNANTYVDPCPTPKVIIIAHSYGGIITRYMLANNIGNIEDKVAAVFFLGAPQLGSPMAVVGYFLPKEIPCLMEDIRSIDDILRKEDFTDRLWDEINFKILRKYERQKVIGNLKFIKWAESEGGLYTSVRDIFDNAAIENAIAGDYQLMALYRKIPPVYQKGTVWATLIPEAQANTYRKKFELYNPANPDKPFVRYIPKDGDLSYDLSKTVLSTLGTDIGVEKVHAIAGTKDYLMREYLYGKAAGYMSGHFNRLDYSCIKNGLWDDGDGVINLASQSAIGEVHQIDAAHISLLWGLLLTGETDHPSTPAIILQAIDDKPVIEDVRIVTSFTPTGSPEKTYFIVKAKDYLLADIEFETGINAENLSEYLDPVNGGYRPYFKFGKDFLKERTDTTVTIRDINGLEAPLKLYPGEFYLRIRGPLHIDDIYLYLKLKNPAKKTAVCEINRYRRTIGEATIYKKGVAGESRLSRSGSPYYGPMWYYGYYAGPARPYEDIRWQGYNEFVSSPLLFYTQFIGGLGARLVASGQWHAYNPHDYNYHVGPPEYADREVEISMDISTFVNIGVHKAYADPDSAIRLAKLIGYFDKELKGGGVDFTISVSHDTSNVWPPTKDSRGDSPIFSFNTNSYQDGADFETIIDPAKLNPGGNNVWQVTSDIPIPSTPQDNCIPESVPNHFSLTFAGISRADFARSAYIRNPLLIVIYE